MKPAMAKKTRLSWNTFLCSTSNQLQHTSFTKPWWLTHTLQKWTADFHTECSSFHPAVTAGYIYTFLATDKVFCIYWQSATVITQPVGGWLPSIIYAKYLEPTRLWSGCFHPLVCSCGSAVWLTADKKQCRILPKCAFCQVSSSQWCSWTTYGPQKNVYINVPKALQNGLYPALSLGFTLRC